jgi:hypothetical protein
MIKSKSMRWTGHVARMAEKHAYRILVGMPEGKRSQVRPRYRWEIGWVVWTGLNWSRMGTTGGLS